MMVLDMKFRQLQENLRRKLLDRISERELTALGLAHLTGFVVQAR